MSDIARLVVAALEAHGFERLFCLPGVQNDDFFDAFFDVQDRIPPIVARHEQGCSYMATGAALATGRPQAYAVVPGQGVLNAAAGHSVAWATSAPVFALHGQIPTEMIGRGLGVLHDVTGQTEAVRGVSKTVERITGPDDAVARVARAVSAAASGRPGPATLEVPVTEWSKAVSWSRGDLFAPPEAPEVDEDAIAGIADALAAARFPMLIVGGGARGVPEDVRRLAELLKGPVTGGMNGKGVLDARHPLWLELPAAYRLWPKVDVALGLGSRMVVVKQWGTDDALTTMSINADPEEPARRTQVDRHVTALCENALPLLIEKLEARLGARENLSDVVADARAGFLEEVARITPQVAYVDMLREELDSDDVLVKDLTQVGFVCRYHYPSHRPRGYLSSGYAGALGWGYAASLGAKAALPDRRVVSIQGDGGFMYGSNELATAVKHGIAAVAVVFDDCAYGNVKRIQQERFGHNRTIASDLTNPDFVRYAESFGAMGLRAKGPEGLRAALREAFRADAPAVIQVPVTAPMASPWAPIFLRSARGATKGQVTSNNVTR